VSQCTAHRFNPTQDCRSSRFGTERFRGSSCVNRRISSPAGRSGKHCFKHWRPHRTITGAVPHHLIHTTLPSTDGHLKPAVSCRKTRAVRCPSTGTHNTVSTAERFSKALLHFARVAQPSIHEPPKHRGPDGSCSAGGPVVGCKLRSGRYHSDPARRALSQVFLLGMLSCPLVFPRNVSLAKLLRPDDCAITVDTPGQHLPPCP